MSWRAQSSYRARGKLGQHVGRGASRVLSQLPKSSITRLTACFCRGTAGQHAILFLVLLGSRDVINLDVFFNTILDLEEKTVTSTF